MLNLFYDLFISLNTIESILFIHIYDLNYKLQIGLLMLVEQHTCVYRAYNIVHILILKKNAPGPHYQQWTSGAFLSALQVSKCV